MSTLDHLYFYSGPKKKWKEIFKKKNKIKGKMKKTKFQIISCCEKALFLKKILLDISKPQKTYTI